MPTLTVAQAKRFYDRFGAKQDQQGFYEDRAIELLLSKGDFAHAHGVFELGCGTGRLAQKLLRDHLPPSASYQAVELSTTMSRLATDRLSAFSDRARVSLCSGEADLPAASQSVDRFLATYVLDLLPDDEIHRMVAEAGRILEPGGLLCLAGVTSGTTLLSRLVMAGWSGLFRIRPSMMGGCRPIQLARLFSTEPWQLEHHQVVVAWGIASEVLVVRRG